MTTTSTPPTIPPHARLIAGRLAAAFEQDRTIVQRLNDAHHCLARANDRLHADFLINAADIHWEIHRAFRAYQTASEERRQLAVDVGELAAQLTATLAAAGYSPEQARAANVHELAAGN